MSEKEINEQLGNDFDKFLYTPYKGAVVVPKNIIDLFKKAILGLPSFSHKINFLKIKAIASKKPNELTNTDLNDVIKVLLNSSLQKLYPDLSFDKVIEQSIQMDKFVIAYNEHVEKFKKQLEEKKATLQLLINGLPKNGMRIVTNGQA